MNNVSVKSTDNRFYVIWEDDKQCGSVYLDKNKYFTFFDKFLSDIKDKEIRYVMALHIQDKFRRKGFATKLMNHLKEVGIKIGVDVLALGVQILNKEAISLYEKLGYIRVGETNGVYIMTLNLKQ